MQNPTVNPASNGQSAPSKPFSSVSASSVSREFQNFLADLEDLVKETTSLTGEDLAQAKEKLNTRLATAKASLEHMNESVVQRAKQSAAVTNEYVHEQPWKALGASTVIAFLLGLAVARRN